MQPLDIPPVLEKLLDAVFNQMDIVATATLGALAFLFAILSSDIRAEPQYKLSRIRFFGLLNLSALLLLAALLAWFLAAMQKSGFFYEVANRVSSQQKPIADALGHFRVEYNVPFQITAMVQGSCFIAAIALIGFVLVTSTRGRKDAN